MQSIATWLAIKHKKHGDLINLEWFPRFLDKYLPLPFKIFFLVFTTILIIVLIKVSV